MGASQSSSSGSTQVQRPQVSEPTSVKHKVHLEFSPEGVATLEVPELDQFLQQEAVPFSERTTWDVLRYVYQIGGLPLARNTLEIIRERQAQHATEAAYRTSLNHTVFPKDASRSAAAPNKSVAPVKPARNSRTSGGTASVVEPPPDYDSRDSSPGVSPSTGRKMRVRVPSGPRTRVSSSSSGDHDMDFIRVNKSGQGHGQMATNLPLHIQSLLPRDPHDQREDDMDNDDWSREQNSTEPANKDGASRRPASKMWKRPMAPEVHADLVRALKERSRESIDASMREEPSREVVEDSTSDEDSP